MEENEIEFQIIELMDLYDNLSREGKERVYKKIKAHIELTESIEERLNEIRSRKGENSKEFLGLG